MSDDLDSVLNEAAESGEGEEDIAAFDFSGAGEGDVDFSDPCPAGKYDAVLLSAKSGVSKQNNPKVTFRFEITTGEWKGKQLFLHSNTTGKSAGRTRKVLVACGAEVEGNTPRINLASLAGAEVVLDVGIQKNDARYNEIKSVSASALGDDTDGIPE